MPTSGGYNPPAGPDATTVSDTDTVDLTLTGNNITADVIVDPLAGNALVANPGGLYVPAAVPDCPTNPMTRAALLALRTAGTLKEECHYVISDGPTIGTAGNTSATLIELHAVSPTVLSLDAKVLTAFDNTAWEGLYDIDLGTAGTITRLADNKGNIVEDVDANAPTVQTEFPWHNTGIRDNKINDSTLTGWGALGAVTIQDNIIVGSTVDMTGKTGTTTLIGDEIRSAFVYIRGSQTVNIQRTYVSGGNATIAAIWSQSSAGALTITDSRIFNNFGLLHYINAGSVTIDNSILRNGELGVSTWNHNAAPTANLSEVELIGSTTGSMVFLQGTGGNLTLTQGKFTRIGTTGVIAKDVQSSSNINLSNFDLIGTTVRQEGSGPITAVGWRDIRSAITSTATTSGGLNIQNYESSASTIAFGTGATRYLNLFGGSLHDSTLTQNRTGGPDSDGFARVNIEGESSVTLSGAVNPGGLQNIMFNTVVRAASTVTITDPANNANPKFRSTIVDAATVTFPAGAGSILNCRFSQGATVNVGAGFDHSSWIVEGAFTKTATAANVNRLTSKAFDDSV